MNPELPKVPAKAVRDRPSGVWKFTVICPFCGKKHFHGGGSGETPARYGSRVPNCDSPTQYEIVPDA